MPSPSVVLERYDLADVVTTNLRVRTLPNAGPASMKYTPYLQPGDTVLVLDGPAFGDGYTWYLVQALLGGSTHGPLGWVAAADQDGDPWVDARGRQRCPDVSPDAPALATVLPELMLHCFGDETIEFTLAGSLYCEGGGPISPDWMVTECEIAETPSGGGDILRLVMNPLAETSIGRGGTGQWALIGHFGDPASATCRAFGYLAERMNSEAAVHFCRTTFVLDTPPTKVGGT